MKHDATYNLLSNDSAKNTQINKYGKMLKMVYLSQVHMTNMFYSFTFLYVL